MKDKPKPYKKGGKVTPMKHGGKVAKYAKGGKVRGMGAAKKGGSYSGCY